MGIHIGVDLGGTNVRTGIVQEDGTVEQLIQEKTEVENGVDRTLEKMIDMIERTAGGRTIATIGIGAPGPLDPHRGVILDPPNLPGWEEVALVERMEAHFGVDVQLDNDANAAALAEAKFGAGRDYTSVFYITVSTGVGGGLVIDGRVFSGAQGYAGEIGNMILQPNGYQYSNLNKGSLESYASGTAIGKRAEELYGIEGGAERVFELVKEGKEEAQHIVEEAVDFLAMAIANLTHIINPEVFVLGGGVMNAGDLIWVPLEERVKEYLFPGLIPEIKLKRAELDGHAGVIGAALLPLQKK
ncbi:ROK family protein [Halobacillus sp. BAB-2008]|uniref:ROK family protein n=1 Tax=Halobacillus sp. BAB-2008 TaxID=1246484 RepID=UPI0002A501BA|nr:ROK family protein [Halobacillus sp. BAB-2008]ELK49108.1 ROK family protein [Halobacillus sp. BAB-2008]